MTILKRQGYTIRDFSVLPGKLSCTMSGQSVRRCHLTLVCELWDEAAWSVVLNLLSAEAASIAAMLHGEPAEEFQFKLKEKRLHFGISPQETNVTCTCDANMDRCIHIKRLMSILPAYFDREPFMYFLLRGMSKQTLLLQLGRFRSQQVQHSQGFKQPQHRIANSKPVQMQEDLLTQLRHQFRQPAFWKKEIHLQQLLQPVYDQVQQRAESMLSYDKSHVQGEKRE